VRGGRERRKGRGKGERRKRGRKREYLQQENFSKR
jgi:hypothetical protein